MVMTTNSNGSAILENSINLAPIVSIEMLKRVSPIKDRLMALLFNVNYRVASSKNLNEMDHACCIK
jgi:hypothetical protein